LTYWGIIRDEKPESLPPIVPIVLHHSAGGWTAARRFEQVIDPRVLGIEELRAFIPKFEMLLDDVSHASDEELRERQLPLVGALTLWLLRDGRNPDRLFAHLVVWSPALEQLAKDPAQRAAFALVLSYITEVLGRDRADLLRQRLAELAPTAEKTMQSIAESWKQEGLEKGLENTRELVRSQLTQKFGVLPQVAVDRIDAATADQLLAYAARILRAKQLDEIFDG
jgi:hypothetical protein